MNGNTFTNPTTTLSVPVTTPTGSYYLGWIISGQVPEYNTDDNRVVIANERLTVLPECSVDGYEPNNVSGQAKTIVPGFPQTHSICGRGDDDWSTFTLTADSSVAIQTSGASGDTRMWLYDNQLNLIEFDNNDGPGLFSRIDRLCGTDPLPAGRYYVRIDENGDNQVIPSYTLSVTATRCCTADPFEPDNNFLQATELNPGRQSHNICPRGDQDWSTFKLSEPSKVVVETSGRAGDTVLALYKRADRGLSLGGARQR